MQAHHQNAPTEQDAPAALILALSRHGAGNLAEAEALYRAVLQDDPRNADALHGLGLLCLGMGRHAEAEPLVRAAIGSRPAPEFFFHLALALEWLGRPDEAASAYRRALALRPGFPEALCNLGALWNVQGRDEEAGAAYRRVLALRPGHVEALSNLGLLLQARGALEEAVAAFRRALAVASDIPEILFNLGNALREQRLFAPAAEAQRRALALRPDFPESLCNLGGALHDHGQLDEAIAVYGRALTCRPGFPDAHWNRALSRLLTGDFGPGWEDYEARWRRLDFHPQGAPFPQPPWNGEPADGRTLLVHAEQGFGDSIQFIRYVPAILERGWRVVVEAPRPLLRLLGTVPGMAAPAVVLVAKGDPLPPFDAQCPMLSLPRAFGTRLDAIPAPVPYLRAEPERVAAWSGLRDSFPGDFRIAVAWQGNPQAPADRGRSFPLAALAPLARVPGVRLVSLQKNHGLEQLDRLPEGMAVTNLGPDFDGGPDAFLDSAAAMMHLDLVVTSDTSVAHLAGALGRPVWLALQKVPDWRWLMDREDCPWYPTMRLFRQERAGDWSGVFARMAGALSRMVKEKAMSKADIRVAISPGELLDKLTILEIKLDRIPDPAKRRNVEAEYALLKRTADQHIPATTELAGLTATLKAINETLWEVEDDIRDCERAQDFGPRFIELARAVYRTNDRRAAVKRQINEALNSALIEEKSYTDY